MASADTKRRKIHHALAEFTLWYENGMADSLANCLALISVQPDELRNPIITFVVPRALDHCVESFVLEVVQAWEIANQELKRFGRRPLGTSAKSYKHLKKIRNKLIAHRIENSLRTDRYEKWYKRHYGTYQKMFELVAGAAKRVNDKIRYLESRNLIRVDQVSSNGPVRFTAADVEAMLAALRSASIY